MKLLTLMMILVPAAAPAAMIIDIIPNVTKLLPQVVGSPLAGCLDEIRLGSKSSRLIGRRQFARAPTAGETALESRPSYYASKAGCTMPSQSGPDITASDRRGKGNRLPLQTVEMMNLRKEYGHE
jgi:hypothetical protein